MLEDSFSQPSRILFPQPCVLHVRGGSTEAFAVFYNTQCSLRWFSKILVKKGRHISCNNFSQIFRSRAWTSKSGYEIISLMLCCLRYEVTVWYFGELSVSVCAWCYFSATSAELNLCSAQPVPRLSFKDACFLSTAAFFSSLLSTRFCFWISKWQKCFHVLKCILSCGKLLQSYLLFQ